MTQDILRIRQDALQAIEAATDLQALEKARIEFLGRKGKLNALMGRIPTLPPEQRPEAGRLLNEAKKMLQECLSAKAEELRAAGAEGTVARRRRRADASAAAREVPFDVTMPGRAPRVGKRHPLLATLDEMVDIFIGMGFAVAEGPEVESHYYSWEALNYPPFHPAMDEQMTFYITDDVMLRSQTSTVQIRVMEAQEPPVRIIIPGRCFRRDTVDATHCHTFYQLEGLLVDRGVTFADLKGALNAFATAMFGENVGFRFRPDFFPFTEPSAEIALTCIVCEGGGCRVCSGSGWLEVGGSGVVDENVLRNVGYDPEEVSGWAFGMGIDRLAMLRHGITDIRYLWENDMRLLGQL
ncbi:MAG: phenylalanine--tRNA ligase subunit alpha [Armatimonadota bacterium]